MFYQRHWEAQFKDRIDSIGPERFRRQTPCLRSITLMEEPQLLNGRNLKERLHADVGIILS